MKSDCNETLRELDRFLDHEVSDEARAHIMGHLDGCGDCLQAYEFHHELRAAIQRKCLNDEMPPDLVERLRQCLSGADLLGDPGRAPGGAPEPLG